MKRKNKVPKRGPARYKHAYNRGYRAGQLRSLKQESNFGAAVIKQEGAAIRDKAVEESPYQKVLLRDATKWQGLMEGLAAMANVGGH